MHRKQFKWDASDYERHSGAQLQWARDLIEKLDLRGHESVLDIGCGDGKVTAAIAARLPEGRVVGIDNSTAMIELARERHAGANLHFKRVDVRNLARTERFDVVFSNAVMHWIKRHLPVLRRVHNALQKKRAPALSNGRTRQCARHRRGDGPIDSGQVVAVF